MSNSPIAEGRPWLASEMPKENLGDFDKQWCYDLFRDPNVKEVPFPSRTITRNSTLHSLFNRTLATNDTLRAAQSFHYNNKKEGRQEALLLASIGDGMDGHPRMAHGGATSLIFDESLSLAALMALDKAFVTVETTIQYRAPVPTPGLVLVRSWVKKKDGRKVWVDGLMEDGKGKALATAQCFFIEKKESAKL